ncbi:MAG TPA: alpha/beta fold hydrolase [Acetobacteraceae bacterium]|nr:alpha/beta fold hydrolase [Acetobacteraceae bacterium]
MDDACLSEAVDDACLSEAADASPSEPPDAILARLETSALRTTSACGAGRMVWRTWGAGPPLVLLHGGSGSWRHWVRNIDAFARDRRVIAPDLPGLGESDLPPHPDDARAMARILADGLAGLVGAGERYDLAGFSFGGVMAGCLAAQEGARVRSLTIVGSGGLGTPRAAVELVKVRRLVGEERVAAHRTNLARLMIADPARIDALALAIQDWNTRHSRLKTPQISRGTWLADALPAVRCPVAGIWGSRDAPSLPDISARERALRVLRPELRFRLIDGAGHWVAYEQAAAFNATLAELMAGTA